jgi:hypothetical protein
MADVGATIVASEVFRVLEALAVELGLGLGLTREVSRLLRALEFAVGLGLALELRVGLVLELRLGLGLLVAPKGI